MSRTHQNVSFDDIVDEMDFDGGFSEEVFLKSVDEDDEFVQELRAKVILACDEMVALLSLMDGRLFTVGMIIEHDDALYSVLVRRR